MAVESLNKYDYKYSHKLAHLLPYDSKRRLFFQILTMTGTAIAWFIVLPILFFIDPGFKAKSLSMLIVTAFMTALVYLIKLSFKRPRPDFKDSRFGTVSFDIYSLPSGHATRAAYVAVLMPIYTPKLALFWYIWAVMMIISRLVLGVHYISDILAGIILGFIVMGLLFALGLLPIFPFLPNF